MRLLVLRSLMMFVTLACLPLTAQHENGLVKWLTLKEAQEKNKVTPKPFLIDIYTDWCGWCKHMMKTTYSNPGLAEYINTNFYPVKFDAETKDTIEYNGQIYKPLSPQPRTPHELAVKFLGEQLSYPSTVFVANNFQFNLLTQGYLDERKIEPLLVYMTENAWQGSNYNEFDTNFSRTFIDTNYVKGTVKTVRIEDLEQLQKKKARKVLVLLTADFCNTCKVMDRTSFTDTILANYINRHFYLVKFNTGRRDTIVYRNQKHYTTLINNFPLHSLSLQLTAGRFSLPALCIMDEELNILDVLPSYRSPQTLKPVLKFIGSDAYKKQNFQEFMNHYNSSQAPAPKQ